MTSDGSVHVRIGALHTTDPRIAREIEDAIDAAVRGREIAGVSAQAAAVAARVMAALEHPDGDQR
jgi:hypothetical protein